MQITDHDVENDGWIDDRVDDWAESPRSSVQNFQSFQSLAEKSIDPSAQKQNTQKQVEVCFRCPQCQKLYKTDLNVFDGGDAEFDCSSCALSFLLKKEQDAFGLFVTSEKQLRSFMSCPKCSSLKPKKTDECPTCGVFASKYIEAQKAESPLLFELNQQWQKVLLNFDQDQFHQDFINKCHLKLALNFAFQKYSDLQKSIGFDSLCKKYISQIEIRMVQQLKAKESSAVTSPVSSLEQISLTQYIFMCIGSIGLLMLIYNKFIPTFPNLNGLVAVFTVFAFGIGIFTKPKSGSEF